MNRLLKQFEMLSSTMTKQFFRRDPRNMGGKPVWVAWKNEAGLGVESAEVTGQNPLVTLRSDFHINSILQYWR